MVRRGAHLEALMKFLTRSRALLASTLLLLSALAPAATADASPANGELCSVQSVDGEIVASVYAFPIVTSGSASRAQIDRAGQWCTNQVNIPGYTGANKNYDSEIGQVTVCLIHFAGESVAFGVYADPSAAYVLGEAEDDCNQIASYNPYVIAWYPFGNYTTPPASAPSGAYYVS
jgi:hypothetical protein